MRKTIIVTGASQGIGAATARLLLEHDYNVVATSRSITRSQAAPASDRMALVDVDLTSPQAGATLVGTATERFGSLDAVVNNAGLFLGRPFVDYTDEDFATLSGVNTRGFLSVTRAAVQQMLRQGTGGSVVTITASLAQQPLRNIPSALQSMIKGGLEAITRSLAVEYAAKDIRFNAVAPGIVDTPMHANTPKDFMRSLSPMGRITGADEIAEAVLFLLSARTVTGEVVRVDGGAHAGVW